MSFIPEAPPQLIPPRFSSDFSDPVQSQNHRDVSEILDLKENSKIGSSSFKTRVKQIPNSCFSVLRDGQWMLFIVDLFAIGSRGCYFAGAAAAKEIPFISIASSPFYLYHALRSAGSRFKLMAIAAKTSRYSDLLFWGGRGIGAMGGAISDVLKPLAGGFTLFGLTHIPAIGILFSLVLPIILILFSVIGGASDGWAMVRSIKALREYKKQMQGLDGSLEGLEALLVSLQGPVKTESNEDYFDLEKTHFFENHFSNAKRMEAIQKKIANILKNNELLEISPFRHELFSPATRLFIESVLQNHKKKNDPHQAELANINQLFQKIDRLFASLLDPNASSFKSTDIILELYETLIRLFEDSDSKYGKAWEGHQELIASIITELKEGQHKVLSLKNSKYEEGKELIDLIHSECHRHLVQHGVSLLIALLIFSAGVLFLMPSSYHVVASGISLASSVLSMVMILFDKTVSQEKFKDLEAFLHLLKLRREEQEFKSS